MNLEGNETTSPRRLSGFALPTILIASIIMLTVLLAAVTSTSSVRAALTAQYYNQLSQNAGESGNAFAKYCLSQNNGIPQWTDEKPLMPNTDCSGNVTHACSGSTDPLCAVMVSGNTMTTFSIGASQVALSGWRQVATSVNHSCGITYESLAYCWGNNNYGILGDGTNSSTNVPVPVNTTSGDSDLYGRTIKSVAVGQSHSCAIADDSIVYCWGYNGEGQLGRTTASQYNNLPKAVSMVNGTSDLYGKKVRQISAAFNNTCVIADDSQVYCWGYNNLGQVGNNDEPNDAYAPKAVYTTGTPMSGKKIVSISTGDFVTCAISADNLIFCWGTNGAGQLGIGSWGGTSDIPVAVNMAGVLAGKTIKAVSVGEMHVCALAADRVGALGTQVYCWGNNTDGQLGDGSDTSSNVPVAVLTAGTPLAGKDIVSISAGEASTCAVASDSQVYCWGLNTSGELGTGVANSGSWTALAVSTTGVLDNKFVMSIEGNLRTRCVVASDSQAYCWGYNNLGQTGGTAGSNSLSPVAVNTVGVPGGKVNEITSIGTTNLLRESNGETWRKFTRKSRLSRSEYIWKQVASGSGYHTCAIASDSKAYCWGNNDDGQLGDNDATYVNKLTPVPVDTSGVLRGKAIKSITTGYDHTCVIASDSKAYCWGGNSNGALGNNSTAESRVPVAVYTGTAGSPGALYGKTLVSIAAFIETTCAIASDSKAYCWGYDSSGQLGNSAPNDGSYSSVPVAVDTSVALSGKGVVAISEGSEWTLAIATDGNAYSWGNNGSGELGNSLGPTDSNVPVQVTNTGALSGKSVLSIDAGGHFGCAIASDSNAYCWGINAEGHLGDNNSPTQRSFPVAVYTSGALSGKKILSISSAYNHSCVIASDSKIYCWGSNDSGQLGDSTTTDNDEAVAVVTTGVLSGLNINSVIAGNYFNYVIGSNGKAYSWGQNSYGQLGNDAIPASGSSVPVDTFAPNYAEYSF